MKTVMLVIYVGMAVWLLISSGARISIQLSSGIPLDALPFISAGLAVLALLVLVPAYEEWRERR